MSRLNNILANIIGRIVPVDRTPSITTTTGVLDSRACIKCGSVVNLTVAVHKTTATAAGQNVYQGTLNDTDLRPPNGKFASGSAYYGKSTATGQLRGSDGRIVIRITGADLAANSDPVYVPFTYVVGGGNT